MGVTHIIRGDDHLTNAARQKQIYDALGWPVPTMAHIPLIHGPDGSKLSKRHGALGIDAYRALGYLPEALRNYLVRLGWSHGDQEIFSTEEMTTLFDLAQIGRSAARFDFVKLESLNGHYIRQTDDVALLAELEKALPFIPNGNELASKLDDTLRGKLLKAMPGLKERAKTLVELLEHSRFIWADRPLQLEDRAKTLLTADARAVLAALLPAFDAIEDWSAETTEAAVRAYAEKANVKLGTIAQPLRAALTGRVTSPGIFDVLAVLGKPEALARMRDQAETTAPVAS
jgi:glutamyl-tRNA synthetase